MADWSRMVHGIGDLQWAAAYQNPGPNYLIDVPFLRIICAIR